MGGGQLTDARTFTLALGGKWHGRYGVAPCPLCQPEGRKGQAALTLSDGASGLLAHCKKSHCGFRDILAAAGIAPGEYQPPDPAIAARREADRRAEADKRAMLAKQIWQEAQPICDTVAESYLRKARGIVCPLPLTLRFAPEAWHGPTARRHPALVALVQGGDGCAVHRTFLRADGSGKADIDPAKAMLGATAGGAVRLSDTTGRLVVAEGIETALSLLCGLLDGPATVWAGLSTSGLRGLRLPAFPGRLTIAPDGDKPGCAAAYALAERATRLGWTVGLLDPGNGRDFNDVLLERAVA